MMKISSGDGDSAVVLPESAIEKIRPGMLIFLGIAIAETRTMVNPLKFFIKVALMIFMISGCPAARSEDAGATRLLSCPDSPNCVSTEAADIHHKIDAFHLKADFTKNWLEIQHVVAALPQSTIVDADKTYLHATFKSRVFRFVDDLELILNRSSGIISIRSAARIGYWDLGVNRRRVEQIRLALQARDLIDRP